MNYLYKTESSLRRDSNGNLIYKKIKHTSNHFMFPEIILPETYTMYVILKKVLKREDEQLYYHPFKYHDSYYVTLRECNSKDEFKIYCDLLGIKDIEKIGDYEMV